LRIFRFAWRFVDAAPLDLCDPPSVGLADFIDLPHFGYGALLAIGQRLR
jgi:hypothetical protein